MSDLDIHNFRESVEWFLHANTPSYLYEHLKNLGEVENLAKKLTHQELYNICKRTLDKKEKNHESELAFYIALIALSLKSYSEFFKYLELLKTSEYKWANHIISLIISNYEPVTTAIINVESKPKMKILEKKSENTNDFDNEQAIRITTYPKVYEEQEQSDDTNISGMINLEHDGDNNG
jgi:hypothetical protein